MTIIASSSVQELSATIRECDVRYEQLGVLTASSVYGIDNGGVSTHALQQNISKRDNYPHIVRHYRHNRGGADDTLLLVCTGHGSQSIEVCAHAISTWERVYQGQLKAFHFFGCALGISRELKKNDVVHITQAVWYDAPKVMDATITYYIPQTVQHKKVDSPMGVALSGDTFVNVITRRSTIPFAKKNPLVILPTGAKSAVERIQRANNHDATDSQQMATCMCTREHCNIILDMESAQLCHYFLTSRRYTALSCMTITRVVLDTIYDTTRISFRKDIVQIAERIAHIVLRIICATV